MIDDDELEWELDDEVPAVPAKPLDEPAADEAPKEYVPTSFEGWFNMGVHHLDQQDYKQSVACFVKAINFQHDHEEVPSAYANLGVAYGKLGQRKYAADAYLAALKLDPRLIEARWGLVKVFLQESRFVDAVAQLRKVSKDHPQYELAQRQIQAVLAQPQAWQLWEEAVGKDPDNPHLHFDLGRIYSILKVHDRALEHLRRVIELAPDNAEAAALLDVTAIDSIGKGT